MAKPEETQTDVLSILRGVVDGVKAGTVFGTPISQNGVTVLPVARISGGGGGGGGTGRDTGGQENDGAGGGLGLSARPVGVYVIRGDKVTWTPAIDATKVILGAQLLGLVALLTVRAIFKARRGQGPAAGQPDMGLDGARSPNSPIRRPPWSRRRGGEAGESSTMRA